MSRSDIAATLASVRLLRGADQGFLDRVAQQPRARFPAGAGETIFEGGDPADAVYVAFPQASAGTAAPRGIVELSLPTNDAGGRAHVEHIVAGDVFGEFEFVASGLGGGRVVRRSSARISVPSDLYRIPYPLLANLIAESEAVRSRLIKLSFDRLTAALNVRSAQLVGDGDAAFADWLIDAADNLGIAEGRHVRFSRTIGQREIADALGVTRETTSLRLNEWERAGLLNTGGQSQRLEILDYPRVALRAALHHEPADRAIDAALAEIDADLSRGDLVRARNIGLDMLALLPSSPDLRHRVALANIRAGNVREALAGLAHGGYATGGDIDVLRKRVRLGLLRPDIAPGRLFFSPGESVDDDEGDEPEVRDFTRRLPVLVEDLSAIEARAQKELAFAAPDRATRQRHATVSADTYANIHDALGGTYAGINAAMMARIAGDETRSTAIAALVVRQVGNRPSGYWAHATLGEARLLAGDLKGAAAAFAAAHHEKDASDGHRSSTRIQIARIGAELGMTIDSLLAALPVGTAAVFSGPLFRGDGLDAAAQDAAEATLRPAVDAALAAEGVHYLYGALACGADIVIVETALAAGIEFHAVLPFPVETFIETSVAIGNPGGGERWTERFWQCLRQSASLTTLVERAPEGRDLDAYYFHGFKLAAGLALLRADALSSRAIMIAAGGRQSSHGIAGTRTAAGDWEATGRSLVRIPLELAGKPGAAARAADPFRPIAFLWPVSEPVDLAAIVSSAAEASGVALDPLERTSRDRRTGAALVLDSIDSAMKVLPALLEAARRAEHPVRIIADFGPVADAKGATSEARISRLSAASDLTGLPGATVVATRTFAARTRAEPGDRVAFVPIGRTAGGGQDKGGDGRPLPAREVYAMTFTGRHAG